MSTSTAVPAPVANVTAVPLVKPDYYVLHGGGIHVTYLPTGAGGVAHLSYQDPHRNVNFSGTQIRTVEVSDIGTLVSVTLTLLVDAGSTTFSVLIPAVNLPASKGSSTVIHTEGVTTVHHLSLAPQLNVGQVETYTVTPLTGNAMNVIIPL